jgi:hypothetical protein
MQHRGKWYLNSDSQFPLRCGEYLERKLTAFLPAKKEKKEEWEELKRVPQD